MGSLRRLFELVPKYWLRGLLALLSLLLGTGLSITIPYLIKSIIDGPLVNGDIAAINGYALLILAIAILRGLAALIQTYCSESMAQSVVFDLRNRLYDHLQQLSFSYYDKAQTGELMSRMTADVETLRMVLGTGLINFIANILTLLAILGMLFSLDWQLALVALVVIPPAYLTARRFSSKARPAYRSLQAQVARLTAFLQENISGTRVVKAFGQEQAETVRFTRQNEDNFARNMASSKIFSFYFPLINLLSGLGVAAILGVGGTKVALGQMSIGTLVAFNTYLAMLLGPIRMFGWVMNMLQRAGASCERIFEVLDTRPEIQDSPDAVTLTGCKGEVEFKDVCFGYAPGQAVLEGISFKVKQGEVIGVVGMTGSGKSTLLNLISRFYEPTSGCVLVDGYDNRKLGLQSLRQNIGMVMQDTFLFSASIRDNIVFGRPMLSTAQMEEAARQASIAEFIETLPEKYETLVGERGIGLSGGQKQRLALARALALKPCILILDDTTSSLDSETEEEILQELRKLQGRITVFVIAHRFSLVKDADKILVLAAGKLVQEGTHSQLLTRAGIYRQMWEIQIEQGVNT